MEQVSINIPLELYKLLEEEAGDVPVEPYIRVLLSRARRQRPRLEMVDSVDSFLQALKSWEEVVDKAGMTVYGGLVGEVLKRYPTVGYESPQEPGFGLWGRALREALRSASYPSDFRGMVNRTLFS